ncbi:hypothetical protein [Nonomuraea sp. 10N515B]|uniref:hypothetical protein n=1 Tax=Nonomuraea sp. 10N515B TaxID=3457422 RepID=UPI003FCD3E22
MIPEGRDGGRGWRAVVAALAFAMAGLIIHALFSSGFGRIARPAEAPPPLAVAPPETRLVTVTRRTSAPFRPSPPAARTRGPASSR